MQRLTTLLDVALAAITSIGVHIADFASIVLSPIVAFLTPILADVTLPPAYEEGIEMAVGIILVVAFLYGIVKIVIAARNKDRGTEGMDGIVSALLVPASPFALVAVMKVVGLWDWLGLELFE